MESFAEEKAGLSRELFRSIATESALKMESARAVESRRALRSESAEVIGTGFSVGAFLREPGLRLF